MNNIYYYSGLPLLTCNVIFYCITYLSTSITSSKNVFQFIYEHKDSDIIIYKNEIEKLDLQNKLKIIHSLIFDIFRKYSLNEEEYLILLNEIKNPVIFTKNDEEYELIEMKNQSSIFEKIKEPILISIISTFEIIEKIYIIMNQVKEKIINYEKSYMKKIMTICLKNEIKNLEKYSEIFDIRSNLLFNILNVYK